MLAIRLLIAVILCAAMSGAYGSELEDIQTQIALEKAKAELLEAKAKVRKAEFDESVAAAAALKEATKGLATYGKAGTVAVKEGAPSLRARTGTLLLTETLAKELCQLLSAAKVSNAIIVTAADTGKLQAAKLFDAQLKSKKKLVDDIRQRLGTSFEDQRPIYPMGPGLVGGAVGLSYLASSIADLASLFRTDRDIRLADANRESSFAPLLQSGCGTSTIKQWSLQLAAVEKSFSSFELFEGELNALRALIAQRDSWKSYWEQSVDRETKKLEELKSAGGSATDQAILSTRIAQARGHVRVIQSEETNLALIQQFLKQVQDNPDQILEKVMWRGILDDIQDSPRLVYALTAQDTEVARSRAFTGTTIARGGAMELLYSVTEAGSARVLASGAVSAATGEEEVDLEAGEIIVVRAGYIQRRPLSRSSARGPRP